MSKRAEDFIRNSVEIIPPVPLSGEAGEEETGIYNRQVLNYRLALAKKAVEYVRIIMSEQTLVQSWPTVQDFIQSVESWKERIGSTPMTPEELEVMAQAHREIERYKEHVDGYSEQLRQYLEHPTVVEAQKEQGMEGWSQSLKNWDQDIKNWARDIKGDISSRASDRSPLSTLDGELATSMHDLKDRYMAARSIDPAFKERLIQTRDSYLRNMAELHDQLAGRAMWDNLRRDALTLNPSVFLSDGARREVKARESQAKVKAVEAMSDPSILIAGGALSEEEVGLFTAKREKVMEVTGARSPDLFIRSTLGPEGTATFKAAEAPVKNTLLQGLKRSLQSARQDGKNSVEYTREMTKPAAHLLAIPKGGRLRIDGMPWLGEEARVRAQQVLEEPGTDLLSFSERLLEAMGLDLATNMRGGINFDVECPPGWNAFYRPSDRSISLSPGATSRLRAFMGGDRSAVGVAGLTTLFHEGIHSQSPAQGIEELGLDAHSPHPARGIEEGLVELSAQEGVKNLMGPDVGVETRIYSEYTHVIKHIYASLGPEALEKLWNQPNEESRLSALAALGYKAKMDRPTKVMPTSMSHSTHSGAISASVGAAGLAANMALAEKQGGAKAAVEAGVVGAGMMGAMHLANVGVLEGAQLAARMLGKEIAERVATKIPMGVGLAVGAGLVALTEKGARDAQKVAHDPHSTVEQRKAALALSARLERDAKFLGISSLIATVPVIGLASIPVDAVGFALDYRDIARDEAAKTETTEVNISKLTRLERIAHMKDMAAGAKKGPITHATTRASL